MSTMTPAQLYKFGFLLRCAEENLTPEQTRERAKLALQQTEKRADLTGVGQITSASANLLKALGTLGVVGTFGGGALLGVGGGIMAANAAHPETSESELRQQEILSELQKNTQRLRAIRAQHAPQLIPKPAPMLR